MVLFMEVISLSIFGNVMRGRNHTRTQQAGAGGMPPVPKRPSPPPEKGHKTQKSPKKRQKDPSGILGLEDSRKNSDLKVSPDPILSVLPNIDENELLSTWG